MHEMEGDGEGNGWIYVRVVRFSRGYTLLWIYRVA